VTAADWERCGFFYEWIITKARFEEDMRWKRASACYRKMTSSLKPMVAKV